MSTVELSTETFNDVINSNENVIVDFWAEWCGPCKRFAPIYESVSEEFTNVVFAKVDAGEYPEIIAAVGIQHIPTLVFIKNGEPVKVVRGANGAAFLRDAISEAFTK